MFPLGSPPRRIHVIRTPVAGAAGSRPADANADLMIDTSGLPKTREKRKVPWRENRVTLLLVREDGSLEQSHLLAEKRRLVAESGERDRLLVVRMLRFHPEVLCADELDVPRDALAG
jgi:ABC-type iron transport system FetAB ATPase subunit